MNAVVSQVTPLVSGVVSNAVSSQQTTSTASRRPVAPRPIAPRPVTISAPAPVSSTGEQVYTTPDGMTIKAGEGDILTDGDGNFLTDEAGNILTTAHLSALGAVAVNTGETMTSVAPSLNSGDTPMISADGLQSDGHFLRTAEGNLLTDEEGNFITPDGNVIKPEEAHKILASQEAAAELVNASEASSGEVLQTAAGEILQTEGGEVLQNSSDEILQNVAGDAISTDAVAVAADAINAENNSEAIAATQLVPGRRSSSLKASYEAINLGVASTAFSIGRELATAANSALAATSTDLTSSGQPQQVKSHLKIYHCVCSLSNAPNRRECVSTN